MMLRRQRINKDVKEKMTHFTDNWGELNPPPCPEALAWAKTQSSWQVAWDNCPDGSWMAFRLGRGVVQDSQRQRLLVMALCKVGRTFLPINADPRLLELYDALEKWAGDEKDPHSAEAILQDAKSIFHSAEAEAYRAWSVRERAKVILHSAEAVLFSVKAAVHSAEAVLFSARVAVYSTWAASYSAEAVFLSAEAASLRSTKDTYHSTRNAALLRAADILREYFPVAPESENG